MVIVCKLSLVPITGPDVTDVVVAVNPVVLPWTPSSTWKVGAGLIYSTISVAVEV